MSFNGINIYPRNLTALEQDWLFYLLPQNIPVYKEYRDKALTMSVIGQGRFAEGNYVLGYEGDTPDLSYPSLPMFACGQIICKECVIQVSVHEMYDNKIEFSINNISGGDIPEALHEIKRWSYSYWRPGSPSPFENDRLRIVELTSIKNELVLVLSEVQQSIWLYESRSQFNHIIPVTNFINELMLAGKFAIKHSGINMEEVFSGLSRFTDVDFRRAFAKYNKTWKKVEKF